MNHQQHYWTPDEIERLKAATLQYGKNWRKIRKNCFKYLREECIRNKFYKLGLHNASDDKTGMSPEPDYQNSQNQLWEITKALGQQPLYYDNY